MIAALPPDENERLLALAEIALLDTPAEPDFDQIVALAAQICETPISLITLVDKHRQWFKAAVGLTLPETPRDIAFCAHAILEPDMFMIPDANLDPRFASNPLVTGDPRIRFYAGIPLSSRGYNLGTLCVIDRKPRQLAPSQESALRVLARQVMVQIELRHQVRALQLAIAEKDCVADELRRSQLELKEANAKLHTLSVTDSLTNLRNRRFFEERLQYEFDVSLRNKSTLSVLLLDVDHFKTINDTFGHNAGDQALRVLARELEKHFRRTDLIARYGGEEFVVLLPNTDESAAMQLAEKVCVDISAAPHHSTLPLEAHKLTVSIGVATTGIAVQEPKDLLSLADRGLYLAKSAGRNACARAIE